MLRGCRLISSLPSRLTTLRSISLSAMTSNKVAVILSGCGVFDGSEVHEASACLVHLSRAGASVSIFAPDIEQMHAIDHTKGEPMDVNRNVLVESARIARGNIAALSEIKPEEFDALIIPGGFGAAKNLCDWAVKNDQCTVNTEVEQTIKKFHSLKKPIGLTCIAPVLAAKCIPGVQLTVGQTDEKSGKWPYAGTAGAMEKCGAKHVPTEVTDAYVDEGNKIVTTAAFMYDGPFHLIYDGIGELVSKVITLTKHGN